MVKLFFALFVIWSLAYAADTNATQMDNPLEEVQVQEDPLISKIQSFLDLRTYENNKDFINVIFDPKSSFYENDRVDSVKVVQTLKENGLLKLYFKKPHELKLNFKTSGAPLFFVKLMGDTLRNIGYYRYVTTASNLDESEFTWNISLSAEYATDPLILEQELQKSGCRVIDIQRESAYEWTYVIDMSHGFLNVQELQSKKNIKLKHSLYAHWLNVSKIKTLRIISSQRNSWYPYITYYDASLHLLKVLKRKSIYKKINLLIPSNAKYMKITDLYTLKNVRDELALHPGASK